MAFQQVWACQDLMGLIYSFDTTFHDQYKLVVEEFEMEEDYGDILKTLVQFRDDNETTTDYYETTDDEDEFYDEDETDDECEDCQNCNNRN